MDNNRLTDKTIEDFILGRLTAEDSKKIKSQIRINPELADQVKLRQEMIGGIEALGRKNLKSQLKQIHKEVVVEKATPSVVRKLFPYIAAAASVLILLLAFYWFKGNSELNPQDLYAANFEQYDISGMQRSNSDKALLKIDQLYSQKKYETVLPFLEAQLALENKNSHLLLATGISYLELNQTEQALQKFNQITTNGDFNFEDEVKWYSALAYLKSNELAACKKELSALINNPTADHHAAAKNLLEIISK